MREGGTETFNGWVKIPAPDTCVVSDASPHRRRAGGTGVPAGAMGSPKGGGSQAVGRQGLAHPLIITPFFSMTSNYNLAFISFSHEPVTSLK